MLNKKLYTYIVYALLLISSVTSTMVFDNRYIPLLQRPRKLIDCRQSKLSSDLLFATSSSAFDTNEEEIGIPEIFGTFDQGVLGESFTTAGLVNPLRTEWYGAKIPWKIDGKMQVQGVKFDYHQKISKLVSVGASWLFLRLNMYNFYLLKIQDINFSLGPSDPVELDDIRRKMFKDIGITNNHTTQIGFGDIDMYLRIGGTWDYTLKCRLIDIGLRGGILAPSGQSALISSASSAPFGGNGHWGFYIEADGLFEVREDMKVGFYTRLSKRLPKTCIHRMPVLTEPHIFGVVEGPARVNPGVTFVLSPFFILENVRQGLGFGVQYTLTTHFHDEWDDMRADQKVPVNLKQIEKTSDWSTSYVTLNVFYDFGKAKANRGFSPVVNFYWDVPAMLFTPKRSLKTHKVTLGVEFPF